jgi:hypothetical protein
MISVDDSCGCTLTRASIAAMKKSDFEDQDNMEVQMDRIIAQTKEARLAGVRERSLTDLLLSRHVALNEGKSSGSPSIIAPFTLVPRRNVVNANYFRVTAGADASSTSCTSGGTTNHAGAWEITVDAGTSDFKSNLVALEKFFIPGMYCNIEYKDTSNSAALVSVQYKIISACNANAGGVEKAVVVLEPNVSSAGWSGIGSTAQALYEAEGGTLMILANSVSDYESYCHNPPSVHDITLIEYWQQTMRWTHCFNDEYVKALQAPLTSNYWKKFKMLPLAQQRKQQEMFMEHSFYNTVFYGDQINELQTVEGYTSLPKVFDPNDTDCHLEYKANTHGIRKQLNDCGRVSDSSGADLSLDTLFNTLYLLKRNRETTSGTIDVIDAMTDRMTASNIRSAMHSYYKAKYGMSDPTMYIQPGQKIEYNGVTVLESNIYDIPDEGVQLAVFTDPYFDDRLAAFDTANKAVGRGLWLLDWSDININVIKTKSVKRQTNVADDLYNCVIQPNVNHYILNSKTFEVRVGDTNRHALIENFSGGCPAVTGDDCPADGS